MKTRSRAVRLFLTATLTLGMTALGFGFAESAFAFPNFPSSSPFTPIAGHEVDTGVIVLQFNPQQEGLAVAVTTPDPADSTAFSTQTGVIGSDGSVSIRDFAGPAAVYLKSTDGQVHELGGAPVPGSFAHRQAASVFRGQTVTFAYALGTDTFTQTGAPTSSPAPSSADEALAQIPITHYNVTPTEVSTGQPVTLEFSEVSPNGVGDPNYSTTVVTYIYGAPDSLGSGSIVAGAYNVTVPGRYADDAHVVAAYDRYGRLVTITEIGDPPVAPPVSTAATHPLDTGTAIIQFTPDMAGTSVTSTVADPTVPGRSSVVSAVIGSDGAASLTNYAGFVRIDISATSGNDNQNPATFRSDVAIYRAQTVTYEHSVTPYGDQYTEVGPTPNPVIPSSASEAQALTPIATANVSPASWQLGSDVTLALTNVSLNSIIPFDSFVVENFVYSSPTTLGSSTIYLMDLPEGGGYAYSFTVPGAFTSGGHVAASFDAFGRLVTIQALDLPTPNATPTPTSSSSAGVPATAAPTASTLANTGQNDLLPAGIAALGLFATGIEAIKVVGRQQRSRASRT